MNFDTFYSIAWLDLTGGPVELSVRDTGGRYFMLPIMDIWTLCGEGWGCGCRPRPSAVLWWCYGVVRLLSCVGPGAQLLPKISSSESWAPFWTLLAVKSSSMYCSAVPAGSAMVTVLPVDGFQV